MVIDSFISFASLRNLYKIKKKIFWKMYLILF